MTTNGNFDALMRILAERDSLTVEASKALEQARKAEITAALTLGILFGTIATVIAACIVVWWL